MYMSMWSEGIDHTDMKKNEFELKDADKNKVKSSFTNHNNNTFSASVDLSTLPGSNTAWTWKGKLETNGGQKVQVQEGVTINP